MLLEPLCVNSEGCFYMLGLLREDMHHVNSLTYSSFFFFLTCSVALAFKFRVINGEGGLRMGMENSVTMY